MTIEHNGLLLDKAHRGAMQAAMLSFLCDARREWRSVYLPGLTHGQTIAEQALPPRVLMEVRERGSALLLLQPVRDRGAPSWADRRTSTHRSRATFIKSSSSAAGRAARCSWCACKRASTMWVTCTAWCTGGRVSFYQSGFDFGRIDDKFSPGLVTVALTIEHNARLGHDCFDFLAGDAQYKKTLATRSEPMRWVELRRDGLALRVENAQRAAGRRGREWLRKRIPGTSVRTSLLLLGSLASVDAA